MNRRILTAVLILISLSFIVSPCYAWDTYPIAEIVNPFVRTYSVGDAADFDGVGSASPPTTGSYDPDNGEPYGGGRGIDVYGWWYGYGNWDYSSGGTPSHTYNTAGAYHVYLYVYDDDEGTRSQYPNTCWVYVVEVKDVTFDPKVLRADGSFTSTASATITPDWRTIRWSIQGPNLGCSINSSTGVITAGTTKGTITVRATDLELSNCYAEAEIKVVNLQELTVSGADFFGGTSPKIYTTPQQAGAYVTITAVLNPSVSVADLPTNFVTWTNGTAGANQLKRLVSRGTAGTDVTVTATCAVSKSARIYVRRVDASNPTIDPDPFVTEFSGAEESNCIPAEPSLESWHVSSVGNYWYARVDQMSCDGIINIEDWQNLPNTMTVPNTANPVDGGNITNALGLNKWDLAKWDLGNYDTEGGGPGPYWHNTSATSAHEWYHWNTDWMVTCIQTIADWSDTETDIEYLFVSVFDYLTEADAKAALTSSVNARFTTFVNAATNHWENVIDSADEPGKGSGAFAAAQAVLDEDIAAIETYRISKGW